MAYLCNGDFSTFFNVTIVPLMAYATFGTSILIALSYMLGSAIGNARLTLWSKTEIVQLFVSVATLVFITITMNTLCVIDMNEVAAIFGQTSPTPNTPMNVYNASLNYLNDAALYSHHALDAVRYHLEGYTVLAYLNAFECDFHTGSIGWGCLFGYSGENQQPVGGYGAMTAALNVFFNSLIIAHFTALNFIFILMFVYRGFVFLFLPLGVFLRAMPYMRSFGALLISLALSFLVIYPFMLGVFWIMEKTVVDSANGFRPAGMPAYDEKIYPDAESMAAVQAAGTVSAGQVHDKYFSGNLENPVGAIAFAANAFIAAVFLPTVALLATIASVVYVARLYGEEIDLSRLTQLV